MQISLSMSGSLSSPSKVRSLKGRLEDLVKELQDEGLTGTLTVSDVEKYHAANQAANAKTELNPKKEG